MALMGYGSQGATPESVITWRAIIMLGVRFALLKNFIEHVGVEPGRLQFSWISSSEAAKSVHLGNTVTAKAKGLGPAKRLIKTRPIRAKPLV